MLIPFVFLLASAADDSQCFNGIPTTEVQSFLNVHNTLRQKIASGKFVAKDKLMPPSIDPIPDLTWDCVIEKSAQEHANDCQFEHSTGLDNLGENMYMTWSSHKISIGGQGNASSNSWANEFQEHGWSNIQFTMSVYNSGVAHATQMVWQKTTKIGCGIALCYGQTSAMVVCQYRDAGHYLGEYVYIPTCYPIC